MSVPSSVLITGASRGLGLEFVKQFLALTPQPKFVFAACRNPDAAKALSDLKTGNSCLHIIQLDVVNEGHIAQAVQTVKAAVGDQGLNLLINNAGVLDHRQKLGSLDKKSMIDSYDTNLVGPLLLSQAFTELLSCAAAKQSAEPLSARRACLVHISTGVASIADNTSGGGMCGYAYRCSKVALNMASRCLALDLAKKNIMSVAMLPGYVKTDMTGNTGNITATESVADMMSTIQLLGDKHNGTFIDRHGQAFPL